MTLANSCNCCGKVEFGKEVVAQLRNLLLQPMITSKIYSNIRRHSLELFNGSIRSVGLRARFFETFGYPLPLPSRSRLLSEENYSNIRRHSLELFNGSIRSVMTNTSFCQTCGELSVRQLPLPSRSRLPRVRGKITAISGGIHQGYSTAYPLSNDEREDLEDLRRVLNSVRQLLTRLRRKLLKHIIWNLAYQPLPHREERIRYGDCCLKQQSLLPLL